MLSEDYTGNQRFPILQRKHVCGIAIQLRIPSKYWEFKLNDVDASVSHKQYIELFRLFWYTAQKTQYYAVMMRWQHDVRACDRRSGCNFLHLWQNEIAQQILFSAVTKCRRMWTVKCFSSSRNESSRRSLSFVLEYAHTDWPTFHHNGAPVYNLEKET